MLQYLHGLFHELGFRAEYLYHEGMIGDVRAVFERFPFQRGRGQQVFSIASAIDEALGADHLGTAYRRTLLTAEHEERQIGPARKGGQPRGIGADGKLSHGNPSHKIIVIHIR